MGQNKKLEVLGWGLVINNDDHTAVICSGISSIGTANDAIEVRAFNPKSNIQAWADAQGIEILNPEMLETAEPEVRMLGAEIIGRIVEPTFIGAKPTPEQYAPAKPSFWQRWRLAIWIAAGSAVASGVYYLLEEILDLF